MNTSNTNESSNVAAIPIGCGNTVARPARPTPWSASFHQLYFLMPNLSIGADASIIRAIFSSAVSSLTKAAALSAAGIEVFSYTGLLLHAANSRAKPMNLRDIFMFLWF